MVVESDTTTWSSGSKRWRLHAGSTVEDSGGSLYQHVVTGSSSIGVVSLGTTSPWGGALEDVPVVATTADIVPSTLTILKVTGTYQKCLKKNHIHCSYTHNLYCFTVEILLMNRLHFIMIGTCDLNYL